jgi:hypothetical protein
MIRNTATMCTVIAGVQKSETTWNSDKLIMTTLKQAKSKCQSNLLKLVCNTCETSIYSELKRS